MEILEKVVENRDKKIYNKSIKREKKGRKKMEEISTGKAVVKFTIKFILWTILFFVIGGIIVGIISGTSIAKVADSDMDDIADVEEMFEAIDGLVYGLIIVELIAALLATKLAIGGVAKKGKITSGNRPKIMRGITIVLVVIAILIIAVHWLLVNTINSYIMKEVKDYSSLQELVKEADDNREKIADIFDIRGESELEDSIDLLKGFVRTENIFQCSGLIYIVMIPLASVFLKKKEQ